MITWILLFLAGIVAGAQNSLAGGGSFVTLGMLVIAGLDPRAANITSTIALFPGQAASGYAGRKMVAGIKDLSFKALWRISLAGGVAGALLLLATPSAFFAGLVPWLVLFATAVFFWGSFLRQSSEHASLLGAGPAAVAQFLIAVYGGYFGGGIGFLMIAALTIAGQNVRMAVATKNALAAAMNASAVVVFAFSDLIHWPAAIALAAGGVIGGLSGSWLLHRLAEKLLRGFIVVVGVALTIWLFIR